MKSKASRQPVHERHGGSRNMVFTAAVAVAAAVVPVSAVLALGLSHRARRVLASGFVSGACAPDVARRLAFGWMAGFGLVMSGEAAGAAAGPLSMLDPVGLMAHTLFGLCDEAVMTAVTILVFRRGRTALSAHIDG